MAETATLKAGSRVPVRIRAYCCFAIVVTAFDGFLYFADHTQALVVPYTGWVPSMCYFVTIPFACFAAASTRFAEAVRFIRRCMMLAVAIGVVDFLLTFGGEDFGNPYLRVSPLRPLFTVFVPIVWLVLLRTKTVSDEN